jgi:hypothetical protein
MRHLPRRLVQVGALCVLLVCAACATNVTLKQVMADPGSSRGKKVALTGTVDKPLSVTGQGVYRLTNGDAHVWVKSTKGVPQPGTTARVTGRIYDAYDVSGLPLPLPDAMRRGMILIESSRDVASEHTDGR